MKPPSEQVIDRPSAARDGSAMICASSIAPSDGDDPNGIRRARPAVAHRRRDPAAVCAMLEPARRRGEPSSPAAFDRLNILNPGRTLDMPAAAPA